MGIEVAGILKSLVFQQTAFSFLADTPFVLADEVRILSKSLVRTLMRYSQSFRPEIA